jgi:PEP-CTERM motif
MSEINHGWIWRRVPLALLCAALAASAAWAGPVTATAGKDPGWASGFTPDLFADLIPFWSTPGLAAPFNGSIGDDVVGPNFTASWTIGGYSAPSTVASSTFTLGIWDHDSGATCTASDGTYAGSCPGGDAVKSFKVDGVDLTSQLNAAFDASGGGYNEYDVYTLTLPGSVDALLSGSSSASVSLTLQGPGLVFDISTFGYDQTPDNGAAVMYSTLTMEGATSPVPEPSSLVLICTGFAALAIIGRKKLPAAQ